ncbi:MAG: hydrolase [Planctomycetota bacterium]
MHPHLMDPAESACLLVVDVQERFRPVIDGFEDMLRACARIARTFGILGLPIAVTEQYPRGLGKTVPELLDVFFAAGIPWRPFEKTGFSAWSAPGLPERFEELRPLGSVLVVGIEAHVCVQQSVHDLLAKGFRVQVAVDAVSSRRPSDREVALRRMERSGAVLTTTEMAAFELLRDAAHPKFKEVQALYK